MNSEGKVFFFDESDKVVEIGPMSYLAMRYDDGSRRNLRKIFFVRKGGHLV